MPTETLRVAGATALLGLAMPAAPALADDPIGNVAFNEASIDARTRAVAVDEPMAVFAQILAQIPSEASIHPTENYYYFTFEGNGRTYAGNLRLHPEERDEGIVHFAYFDTADPSWFRHLSLDASDGVRLDRKGPLAYRLAYGEHAVTFRMNPLLQVDPGLPTVAAGEVFVGRGMDESGLILTLVYSFAAERFLWVLDPDQTMEVPLAPFDAGLDVHVASGFAFLGSPASPRRVLVGVDAHEVVRNTWNDGPFDQLPDNWLDRTRFRELAERSDPALHGRINARGEFRDGESRLAVAPYLQYRALSEITDRRDVCRSWSGGSDALLAACIIDLAES